MAIVKYKNQSGITYAYESIAEWDSEKKQSRPKRKYLGRVDPETGEIIPTAGKRGRPRKHTEKADPPVVDHKALYERTSAELDETKERVAFLEQENKRLKECLANIYHAAEEGMNHS